MMKIYSLLSLLALLIACQSPLETIEVTRVVATAVPPTPTPTAAPLSRVTAAPTQLVPTELPTATATMAILPTPSPVPSPTASPAPLSLGAPKILGRGQMMDADFSADGHTLAIAWAAGLSLVDTAGAREIWWQPLTVPPLAIDMQADGQTIAVAMGDGTMMVWHTGDNTGETIAVTDRIVTRGDVAWSPDESELAAQFIGPSYGGLITRVDMATGQINEIPATQHPQTYPYLVWSPDGRLISEADWDEDCTQLVDVNNGETGFTLQRPDGCYASHALAWAPDGRSLALGNPAGTIDLVELATGTVIQSLSGTISTLLPWLQTAPPLFFNADGSLLVSIGGLDYYGSHPLTVWRVDTGEVVGEANSMTPNRLASAFVDEVLVSLYEDGTMTRWDFAAQGEEEVVGRLPVAIGGWPPFVWSEDGRYIASGERQGGLVVWDVDAGQPQLVLDREMAVVAFSPDSQLLAAVDRRQSELYLYDLATGQINRTWPGATAYMHGVAFAPDGQHIAYGAGNEVVVAEVASGVETAVLTGYPPDQTITQIRWSPDGTALIAASAMLEGEEDVIGLTILWEQSAVDTWTEAFRAEHFFNDSYPEALTASFNPAGSLVAFESLPDRSGIQSKIFVYDRQQAVVILTLEAYRLIAWQSDELLLTTEALGNILLTQWHAHTGEKMVGIVQGIGGSVFAPDGAFFAQPTSSRRNVEIREWLFDQVVAQGQAGREIGQMSWSPDGRFLAASASDGTITVWPVISGQ